MIVNILTKLSKQARNAASASLIIIAAIAMYNWTIPPHSNYLSSAKGYESTIDNIIKHNKIIETQLKTKKIELQKLRESTTYLQNVLFNPEQAKEFFSDLQVISEQSGCVVQSTNFIPENKEFDKEHIGITTRSATISVVGIFRDIETFVGRLQSRTQKVWIDSIKMQNLEENSNSVICDLTITIYQFTDKDIQ